MVCHFRTFRISPGGLGLGSDLFDAFFKTFANDKSVHAVQDVIYSNLQDTFESTFGLLHVIVPKPSGTKPVASERVPNGKTLVERFQFPQCH